MPTLAAWPLRGHTALKSILRETLFLVQLHDFSLLSLNSFFHPFLTSKFMRKNSFTPKNFIFEVRLSPPAWELRLINNSHNHILFFTFTFRLESEETDLDELSESDDLDDPDDLHDENFDNLEAPALIEDRTLLIPQEELSVSNIRNVLSHVSGTHPAEIERLFVEKQESQGKDIKVIVTDEYLQKYAKPLYLANLLCQQFK